MLSLKRLVALVLTVPFGIATCSAGAAGPLFATTPSAAKQRETVAVKTMRGAISPAATAHIEAVQAVAEARGTRLDITLRGTFHLAWEGQGTRWQVRLSGAIPTAQLASRMQSGGLVTRIGASVTPENKTTLLTLDLSAPARCALVRGCAPDPVCFRFIPETAEDPSSAFHAVSPGLYDVEAVQADAATLLTSLAHEAGINLVMAGAVNSKVSLKLRHAPVEQAIDLLARAAGLTWHHDKETYLIGSEKEIEALYPTPKQEAAAPPAPREEVYTCRHVVAAELVKTLEKIFEKEPVHFGLGASSYTPRLDDAATVAVTGVQSAATHNNTDAGAASTGARDVVISGEATSVERALTLARKLDRRRAQVRINVRITDINSGAMRELGVRWNWSPYRVSEVPNVTSGTTGTSGTGTTGTGSGGTSGSTSNQVNGISFGTIAHDAAYIEATLSALETSNRAKLLAAPTLSLLDGEHGFILIGDRLVFPVLSGYTQAQTPIFTKEEERVGIYLQVAAQTTENGEITLTIYPQVSEVTSYLQVNGASYPQISTREQQTTVRVKDGEKIVVGGLIRDEDIRNLQRVPVLSRIPFFGELFTYRSKTHNRSEVIIMITPEILKD